MTTVAREPRGSTGDELLPQPRAGLSSERAAKLEDTTPHPSTAQYQPSPAQPPTRSPALGSGRVATSPLAHTKPILRFSESSQALNTQGLTWTEVLPAGNPSFPESSMCGQHLHLRPSHTLTLASEKGKLILLPSSQTTEAQEVEARTPAPRSLFLLIC